MLSSLLMRPEVVINDPVSVLPGIAFSLDLIERTNKYGVSEVLLSSFMAAFIFSIFGAQPLTIAGVTGKPSSVHERRTTHKARLFRTYHRSQSDDLRFNQQQRERSGLSTVCWLGISLGSYPALGDGGSWLGGMNGETGGC